MSLSHMDKIETEVRHINDSLATAVRPNLKYIYRRLTATRRLIYALILLQFVLIGLVVYVAWDLGVNFGDWS